MNPDGPLYCWSVWTCLITLPMLQPNKCWSRNLGNGYWRVLESHSHEGIRGKEIITHITAVPHAFRRSGAESSSSPLLGQGSGVKITPSDQIDREMKSETGGLTALQHWPCSCSLLHPVAWLLVSPRRNYHKSLYCSLAMSRAWPTKIICGVPQTSRKPLRRRWCGSQSIDRIFYTSSIAKLYLRKVKIPAKPGARKAWKECSMDD